MARIERGLKCRTRDAQGNLQQRPTRLARGVQEVLNRRRPRKPGASALGNPTYTALLNLAVHGTTDKLAGGSLRFIARKGPCPCCGKMQLRDEKREQVRRKIARIKKELGLAS